jgi:thiol-disulfide isomerase/thioredoxin
MLGSRSLEIGPFNLPFWLIAAAAGYVIMLVLRRTALRRWKSPIAQANDLLANGLIAAFLVWKLTPLATRFELIAAEPLRLLYYPGGTAGLVAGIGAAVAVIALSRRRQLVRSRAAQDSEQPPSTRSLLAAGAATIAVVLLPVLVVSLIPAPSRSTLPGARVEIVEPSGGDTVVDLRGAAGGRPVVLVFWATWCGPCTAQMPEIDRFYREYGAEVAVFAVNLTATESGRGAVASYLEENELALPVVLDAADGIRSAAGVSATPTTVIYDPRGAERVRRTGAVTARWIERRVLPLRD